jgi:glycosyltransferase involved in cell wall biosynthesis
VLTGNSTKTPPSGTANEGEKKVVVIVPTLNEEGGIGFVLDRIEKALQHYNYGILVVDGHSSDDTLRIAKDKGARIVLQPGNGYGDALRSGFGYACREMGADVVVMADGDGTYDPFDVPAVVDPILKNESDVVIGNRFGRMDGGAMPLINVVGNRILSLVARMLLDIDTSDTQCGLRAMRAELVSRVRIESEGMPFATEMLAKFRKMGARISQVPVSYHVRTGNSKLRRFEDGFDILRTIFAEI